MKARSLVAVAALLIVTPPLHAQDETREIVPRASRDVTPPGATHLPASDTPLTREPVPPPPPDPARWRRFALPRTTDAATFKVDRLTIRVSGVSPPAADQTCRMANGEDWPCGQTALLSLRLFLGGRAVECYFPRPEGVEEIVAPCRVGKTDLGQWLLGEGWATPDSNATSAYRDAARQAECTGKGLWRHAARPSNCN